MDKVKRNERLAVMLHVLGSAPNRIVPFSTFCEMFGSAKSTVSEDTDLLQKMALRYGLGKVETLTGAAGGVRFRPLDLGEKRRERVLALCERLEEPDRVLPGGFLYQSDLLSDPSAVSDMARIFAGVSYPLLPEFILTMETKGIPVAMLTAQAMSLPLVIARHSNKVYEGSAVNIFYMTSSGRIETMSLSRRAVREGSRALIVDDFMRGGGTVNGMRSLMKEFHVDVVGACVVLAVEDANHPIPQDVKALMLLSRGEDGQTLKVRPGDWL